MKTTIEVNGYEIKIEEMEGKIMVSAMKDDEVVEECLCFGWIDSKPNKKDEQSYYLFIAPRKPKSVWSALNKN